MIKTRENFDKCDYAPAFITVTFRLLATAQRRLLAVGVCHSLRRFCLRPHLQDLNCECVEIHGQLRHDAQLTRCKLNSGVAKLQMQGESNLT